MRKYLIKFIFIFILIFYLIPMNSVSGDPVVNKKYSQIIWKYLEKLCEFGPRNPGSKGYKDTIKLISQVGMKYADHVVEYPFKVQLSEGKTTRKNESCQSWELMMEAPLQQFYWVLRIIYSKTQCQDPFI